MGVKQEDRRAGSDAEQGQAASAPRASGIVHAAAGRANIRERFPLSETKCVRAVIRGRVQGVGFRAWTSDLARSLGLSGHVRNRADGAVEAVLSGPDEDVDALLQACRQGPRGARVDDVSVESVDPADAPSGPFRILG